MVGLKANYSSVIGALWILFGAVWLGVSVYGLLASQFLPEHGGTQSYLIVLLFSFGAIAAGFAQVFAKIVGFFGTALLSILLLFYIVLYFIFVGHRSGPFLIAYCVSVAIFSVATFRCFAIRLKNVKPDHSAH